MPVPHQVKFSLGLDEFDFEPGLPVGNLDFGTPILLYSSRVIFLDVFSVTHLRFFSFAWFINRSNFTLAVHEPDGPLACLRNVGDSDSMLHAITVFSAR